MGGAGRTNKPLPRGADPLRLTRQLLEAMRGARSLPRVGAHPSLLTLGWRGENARAEARRRSAGEPPARPGSNVLWFRESEL